MIPLEHLTHLVSIKKKKIVKKKNWPLPEEMLPKIDFLRRERVQFDEFINKEEVHSILSLNFGRISDNWFKFSTTWNYNAYETFMDMDKYLILIYLVQKSFRHYADILIIHSEEQFYTKEEFEIEKINLIEIQL